MTECTIFSVRVRVRVRMPPERTTVEATAERTAVSEAAIEPATSSWIPFAMCVGVGIRLGGRVGVIAFSVRFEEGWPSSSGPSTPIVEGWKRACCSEGDKL